MPQIFAGSAAYPSEAHRPVLTIGNFDGLHHGHRHLISRLVERANELGLPSCVYTFDPPPRVVLAPTRHQPRIQTWPDKVRIMGELGVDQVVVERFTRSFARHPPRWFVEEILGRRIVPKALVLGYDFRFGRGPPGPALAGHKGRNHRFLREHRGDYQGGCPAQNAARWEVFGSRLCPSQDSGGCR